MSNAHERLLRRKNRGISNTSTGLFSLEYNSQIMSLAEYENIGLSESEVGVLGENFIREYKIIEREFEEKTSLNAGEVIFMGFATGLQCARQYCLTNKMGRAKNDQTAGKFTKKWFPIELTGPVPYDAFKYYGENLKSGVWGGNHRYTTLGHDPLMGWVFGVANILTETVTVTLTKNNFSLNSYNTTLVGNEYKISTPCTSTIGSVLGDSCDRVASENGAKDLAKAVLKHAIHLESDAFTTMGLPVPILNNILPDQLSGKMLNNGLDVYSVARGAALSSLINMIIAYIRAIFYNPNGNISRELYEVKTRKIILYSNSIASLSNIIYVALSRDLKKLDLGGIIVTLYRICKDRKFIHNIKKEFIYGKLDAEVDAEIRELDEKIKFYETRLGI